MNAKEMLLNFVNDADDINRLSQWIFENIEPYIKGRTLELGSSRGGISSIFIKRSLPVHLCDENGANRETLRKRFGGMQAMRMIHDIDFNDPFFDQVYADSAGVFSTVIAVNVAEHGIYENRMIHRAKYFLGSGGHFMLAMPASVILFGNVGSHIDDLKQHNYKVARHFMGDNFEPLKIRHFNWLIDPNNCNLSHLYTLTIFRYKGA